MKKALVFDMDGLMIDSEGLYFEVEREMAREFGQVAEDALMWKMMGRSPLESMRIFARELRLPASPEDLLTARQARVEKKMLSEVLPMKGLYEIIETFHEKLKLAISTSSPRRFVDIALEKLRLEHIFDVIQTHEDVTKGKPEPDIYLKAAEKLEVRPGECIVLEDSHNGALAARRAGCYCIAIPNEYTKEQDFSFVHHIAEDLLEARRHICSSL